MMKKIEDFISENKDKFSVNPPENSLETFKEKLKKLEDPLVRIIAEFNKFKGTLVITDNKTIERLIAIGKDELDYYYVCWNGQKSTWHTCVGSLIPLKGYIRKKDYQHLLHLDKLNSYDSPYLWGAKTEKDKENISHINKNAREEGEKLCENEEFLTEICWDIN